MFSLPARWQDIKAAEIRRYRLTAAWSANVRLYQRAAATASSAEHIRRRAVTWMESTIRHPASTLIGVFDEILLHYELVPVEASPLLLPADTEFLAANAAVTFLTVETGKVSKRAAKLTERLRTRELPPSSTASHEVIRLRASAEFPGVRSLSKQVIGFPAPGTWRAGTVRHVPGAGETLISAPL